MRYSVAAYTTIVWAILLMARFTHHSKEDVNQCAFWMSVVFIFIMANKFAVAHDQAETRQRKILELVDDLHSDHVRKMPRR